MANGSLNIQSIKQLTKFSLITKFKKNLFRKEELLINVINKFNRNKQKIILLINNNNSIVATLTIGDIAKALSKYKHTKIPIDKIANKNFLYMNYKIFLKDKDRKIFFSKNNLKNVNYIPVLKNKKIISLIKIKKKIYPQKIPVVIMAGGKGKRLLPITKKIPKPMVKVNGIPMIESLINNFKEYKYKNFYISVNYLKDKIKNYLKKKNLKVNIEYINEKKYLGTAGSLYFFKFINNSVADNDNLIVTNCDIDMSLNLESLIKFHNEKKSDFTIVSKLILNRSSFGIIEAKNFDVIRLQEKMEYEQFINCGIYVLKRRCLKILQNNTRIEMNVFINKLIKKKFKVLKYPVVDEWKDLGQKKKITY